MRVPRMRILALALMLLLPSTAGAFASPGTPSLLPLAHDDAPPERGEADDKPPEDPKRGGAGPQHDDGGSGRDAPDDRGSAMNASPGTYVGNLTPVPTLEDVLDQASAGEDPTQDADWYRTNSSSASPTVACTSAAFHTRESPHERVRVHLEEPSLHAANVNTTTNGTGAALAHVGPDPSGTLVGLSAIDPIQMTEYAFELDVTTMYEAGGAGSLDEVPGPCFGGTVAAGEDHAWSFAAEEDELFYVSFGTELARSDKLVLEAPNGTPIGSITSADGIAIGAHLVEEPGNYTLRLEASDVDPSTTATSTYLVGFNLVAFDDPEEEEEESPCRPHCMN